MKAQEWIPSVLFVGILLGIYGVTIPPSLTWSHYGADGGDLVTAVARGGIPHPPGFPTYLLLGELFIRLPWRDPAWRLNLLSTAMAAGAVALTVAAVRVGRGAVERRSRGAEGQGSGGAICDMRYAICAGLCLGLAPLFWSQALITEVYVPAAFFTALVLLLTLRGVPVWALGLAWGIGLGVHPMLIFLAPLVLWAAWKDEEVLVVATFARGAGRLKSSLRAVVQAGLLAVMAWAILYGPVLLARSSVPSPWADVSTLAGWWTLVSGRLYRGYVFALSLAAWPQRVLAWAGLLARQFTPVGAVLAGLGWVWLWRKQRALAVASALSFGAFSLYAVGYNTADSLVYLVPALPLAALWLGAGLAQAGNWLNRRVGWGAWVLLLLPLCQVLLFWGQMDLHRDHSAMEWAERVLEQAPPQAVLLTAQDAHTFTLWYAHDVLDERPDVTIIDRDLWGYEPYRRMVTEDLGPEAASGDLSEAVNRAARPVVSVSNGN